MIQASNVFIMKITELVFRIHLKNKPGSIGILCFRDITKVGFTLRCCNVKLKVGLSPLTESLYYLLQSKPFKINEKCFLFHI